MAYLRDVMGREEFDEVVESGNNEELNTILHVCLV